MKVQEKYFEDVALPNFLIIGAIVKINLNNRYYAMHRITDILPWKFGEHYCSTVITTPITKDFKHTYQDGGFLKVRVWSEKELLKEMKFPPSPMFWEHDALPFFAEQSYTHLS